MKSLLYVLCFASAPSMAVTFTCPGSLEEGESYGIIREEVTIKDDRVFIKDVMKGAPSETFELFYVGKSHGEYVYEKQVEQVRFKKDDEGNILSVHTVVDNTYTYCE